MSRSVHDNGFYATTFRTQFPEFEVTTYREVFGIISEEPAIGKTPRCTTMRDSTRTAAVLTAQLSEERLLQPVQ